MDTCRTLYTRYEDSTVLVKCKRYADWTLPYLMADVHPGTTRAATRNDYQETGSILVNHLANKLAQLLFPAQYPFFRAEVSGSLEAVASQMGMDKADVRKTLAKLEQSANRNLFKNGGYAGLILALKSLVVTGNVLIHRDSLNSTVVVHTLNKFVTQRDSNGELLDCILREYTTFSALPQDLQLQLMQLIPGSENSPNRTVEKYTRIKREYREGQKGYLVYNELDTFRVGEPSWYPGLLCPYTAPTWNLIPGEHYGRSYVADSAGGFAKLSELSEQLLLYSVESMRLIHLVGPGSGAAIDDLMGADTGAWVPGDPAQVQVHEAGDSQKLQFISAVIQDTVQKLQQAFLYVGDARDSDRTTAYEIQMKAQEADYSLGGVYSSLAAQVQLPLAHVLLSEVSQESAIGVMTGELQPDITVGVAALGRSSDVQNLLMASQELMTIAQISQVDRRIDIKRITDVIFAGRSIDPETVFYTDEEMQAMAEADQAQQEAQMQLVQAQGLTEAADSISKIV